MEESCVCGEGVGGEREETHRERERKMRRNMRMRIIGNGMILMSVLLCGMMVHEGIIGVEAAEEVDVLIGTEGDPYPVLYYATPETKGQIDDAHPVHGVELSNGDYAIVGKALRCEKCKDVEGFVLVVDGNTGQTKWQWTPQANGREDAINAVVEIPDGTGDLLVVGFQIPENSGGVAKRAVTRLDSQGKEVWTSTDFGDTQQSHGAWEMVTVSDDKSSVLLSGVHKRATNEEMWFKSYGNVADGNAVVMEIPIALLAAPVSAESASWTQEWTEFGMMTAKAARPVPGGGVIVLLWGDEDDSSASLQYFDANRRSVWGPIRYGEQHGEGTDVAVTADGNAFVITGHGCTKCEGELLGKLTKVRSDGAMLWSKPYASCDPEMFPTCTPIFNECWGVGAIGVNDGFVLACGTGLEYCEELDGDAAQQCRREQPVVLDPRPGALPRPPAVWASLVVRVDNDGNMVWQRVDQFREEDAPKAGEPGWEAWSSASEYVIVSDNGDLAFVQDEVSGVGLMKLSAGDSSQPPKIDAVDPCFCTEEYRPVCSVVTGITYENPCKAQCRGETSFAEGECGVKNEDDDMTHASPPTPLCQCTREWKPVCDTSSRVTYTNACMASCEGITFVPGHCNDISPPPTSSPEPGKPCMCTKEYRPVCSVVTGVTHGNECMAKCAGDEPFFEGECKPLSPPSSPSSPPPQSGCACPRNWNPVCDIQSNTTYANACMAGCEGATFSFGECGKVDTPLPPLPGSNAPSPCLCTMEYMPVCATTTNTTYGNECEARCAGESTVNNGPCTDPKISDPLPPPCACPRDYTPVCDIDGDVTYPNKCFADCQGIESTMPGDCSDINTQAIREMRGNLNGERSGEGERDDDLMWLAMEFLRTANEQLDPELTARFMDFFHALFDAAVTFDTNRKRTPGPPPSFLTQPLDPIANARMTEPQPIQQQPTTMQQPDTARFRELIERITRAIPPLPYQPGDEDGRRPIARLISRVRSGNEPTVTLSAYDFETVYIRNDQCAYPFEYGGVLHNNCVTIDGMGDMCRNATNQFVYCYEMDASLFDPLVTDP